MVLYVLKWDIHPDKTEAYGKWTEGAIRRLLAAPGVVEFRGYRVAIGTHRHVVTHEFADLAAWAAWNSNDQVQQVLTELDTLALNVTHELWGLSPRVPKPIRPGQ
jgi:quinol monooxygenase YgiN